MLQIYAFSSVKLLDIKLRLCKKSDKYEVCKERKPFGEMADCILVFVFLFCIFNSFFFLSFFVFCILKEGKPFGMMTDCIFKSFQTEPTRIKPNHFKLNQTIRGTFNDDSNCIKTKPVCERLYQFQSNHLTSQYYLTKPRIQLM